MGSTVQVTIDGNGMGDDATYEDAEAYRDFLDARLTERYPNADVSVTLLPEGDSAPTRVAAVDGDGRAFDDDVGDVLTSLWEDFCADPHLWPSSRVACACGAWSGVRCGWQGLASETVEVEYMPGQHRSSHEAAGLTCLAAAGRYPVNGARRIRVSAECAALMVESDADWCAEVSTGR